MANNPERGEVWLADLGFAAKVRPVLIVSVPFGLQDYALVQVIPHTTQIRGSSFAVNLPIPFLAPGVFNIQGMAAVPVVKFEKRLGTLSLAQMATIEAGVKRWLGLRD